MDEITCIGGGLGVIFEYDNIAIVVLMSVVILESTMIYYLLKNLFMTKDVLNNLKNVITILNERLSHHD